MREQGSCKVGTLHEYRNAEKYDARILDVEEGLVRYKEHIQSLAEFAAAGRDDFQGRQPRINFITAVRASLGA